MDDIKRPYRSSPSRKPVSQSRQPGLRAHQREIYKKVEEFETDEYATDAEDDNFDVRGDIKSYYARQSSEESEGFKISKFTLFSAGSLLFLFAAIMMFTFVWNSATINITPRVYAFTVDTEINLASTTVGYFASSSDMVKKSLERSEKKLMQSKAVGEITIYNNYSESTQKLVKNTRFESNGIIFRITDSVVVPGKVGNTPGSVAAKVTADSFGDNYNIKPSRFTIPGFKNSSRYDGFYAESYKNMTGGAAGERYVVSDDAIALADTSMQNSLRDSLTKSLLAKSLEGYFYATNTMYFVYTNNLNDYESGKASEYQVYGTVYVLAVDSKSFSDRVAKVVNKSYDKKDEYRIQTYNDIIISPKSDIQKDKTITVKGKGNLIYAVDYEKVKRELLSKDETEYSSILSKFSSIEKADISISPFWVHIFPKNVEKLKVKEILP